MAMGILIDAKNMYAICGRGFLWCEIILQQVKQKSIKKVMSNVPNKKPVCSVNTCKCFFFYKNVLYNCNTIVLLHMECE